MIDFHCHSTFSDGTDTPEELVRLADEVRLDALALTDHDTVDGLARFLEMQAHSKARLVPGVEISCRFLGRQLHILGLLIDHEDPLFRKRLAGLRQWRDDRNARMLEKLQALGHPLTWEAVLAQAPTPLVARPHFAKALVAVGSASSPEDAFRRHIGDHAPGYVEREELSPKEAAQWIWEAGGIPLVAHPGRFGRGFLWDKAMEELRQAGLAGFEAYYSDYSAPEEAYFNALAGRLGMARSGGSDYHGTLKPGVKIGLGRGNLRVPSELLGELETARGQGSWN